MNFRTITDKIRTEADAYEFLESLRWGDTAPECPHCAHPDTVFITPANGVSRATRTGKQSQRRVWRCRGCRKQFSVITGTVFHGTKVSLRVWVLVIFEMCASKNGVAAREVERKYGVCARTAWFMMHRIREAMTRDSLVVQMRGTIVADETYFGGSYENQHKSQHTPERVVPGQRPRVGPGYGKQIVLTLIDSESGEARSKVVPDVTGATLRKAIAEQVDMAGSVLHTDEAAGYGTFASEFIAHETVNHAQDEYVRYDNGRVITSNQAENFFSQLKRSIDGTHHHVSKEHLARYLAEFDYRFTTRTTTDAGRMVNLMGRIGGKRLTYKRVAE